MGWGPRFNKFGNTRVKKSEDTDGYSFASEGEFACYRLLKLRVQAGEIRDLQCQEHVYLTKARICYIADFTFIENETGEKAWGEYKGFETPEWKLKLNLWRYYGPGKLYLYVKGSKGPRLKEIVTPKE